MQKYWLIFKLHWQNGLTYPVSFFLWRFRQFLVTFAALTFWTVLYQNTSSAFGYSQQGMQSYIFVIAILQGIIVSTFLNGLAQDIYTGQLTNLLVKPTKPIFVWITQELADKSMNLTFVSVELGILYLLFKPQLVIPSLPILLAFIGSAVLGAVVLFGVMMLLGMIGFWSPDTWGPRFLFYMFLEITAGKMFPLDIFPKIIQNIIFFTPFPYLSYVQTQIFLGKMSWPQIGQTFFFLFFWSAVLIAYYRYLWNKGMKEYGAVGR